jgi:2'-5' RNA ligase
MADLRAFIAVPLADTALAAVGRATDILRERPGGDSVRWVRPEGLHVTLRFLGTIAAERTPILAHHMGRAVAGCEPFELTLGALHAFPTPRRPRVVAISVAPEEPLSELAEAVERGVVASGFEPESRPFRAHLTLGRLRGGHAPDLSGIDELRATSPVHEAVLYESRLGRGGSRYVPLERVPLGANDSPRIHP